MQKRSGKKSLIILLIAFLSISGSLQAGTPDTLQFTPSLARLEALGDSLLKGSSDSIRLTSHLQFLRLCDSVLRQPNSSALSFYQVKALSVLKEESGRFIFYQWMVSSMNRDSFAFFGFARINDMKTHSSHLFRLTDNHPADNEQAAMRKSDTSSWYGCIYYSAVHQRYNHKDSWLLLGWSPHTAVTTRKLIEPFVITNEKPVFGAPVIRSGGRPRARIIFEYNSQVQMSLRYDHDREQVVFDHLSPSDQRPESKGMFSMYGPDLSYDALVFSKGYWLLRQNIDQRNDSKNEGHEVKLNHKLRITR